MRKPKLRDWFLLLVPVVLLAGFAFWRQQNEKPQEPFRLVVKEIRREKLTPLDVYQGLDTKVAVIIGHKGTKPDWWGMNPHLDQLPSYQLMEQPNLYQKGEWLANQGEATQAIARSNPEYSQEYDAYVIAYTARLRDVRDTSAPIILKSKFEMWRTDASTRKVVAAVPMTYEMRRASEKTIIPQASRYRPIKVLDVKLHPITTPPTGTVAASVELEFSGQEPYKTSRAFMEQTKLIDAKGRVFKCSDASSGKTSTVVTTEGITESYSADFTFAYKGKPPVEPVTLDTKISFNGCWPLHVVQKTDSKWFYKS